jgi:DNA-binding NtrC family response regulator
LSRIAARDGRPQRRFEPRALEILQKYHWPGNVRELENICERSVVLEVGEVIRASTIGPWLSTIGVNEDVINGMVAANGVLEELERRTIMKVLEKHNGHRLRTAKELGIGLRTLGMKLKKLKDEGVLVEA